MSKFVCERPLDSLARLYRVGHGILLFHISSRGIHGHSGLLKEYEEQGLFDRATNPKYWMDARGFAADFGNLFGSQIPFFAMSAVMPEIGVVAKVSQVLNSGLGKVGLNRAAGLFAPRVKALVGGEERTLAGGAGREALGDFTSWAPTGVIDAASNTGEVAQYLREQGYSDDEIYGRMKKAFGYELPYDIASQGLFGTFMGGRGVRAALSGKIEGYDLGASGDVSVQVRSLADDAAPFIGVTMDNGTEGCVEAVTKIGANSSAFLAQELKNGVVNVDRLVEDAGDNVIAFDPNQLEEGDVIVYGDESDPQRHVVLYDGKGGYIGNSSSRNLVVHESDYNQMGDWHPTKIIKSGALFRGTSVRSISAPQMDFTGLVFDEKDIAATQKALNNLVHGGQPTPEQSAAILSAAEAIRDMPLGSVDKTAEAESYNEWQKLIDTKDIAGIVDKDPEGVARMVHQLAGAQKQQQTRAAIENQQQIEATKQALEAVQKQRYEAAQARINNAVAQRNATAQDPQMQVEAPMQTPQIPMQAAQTNNIVGDTVVENVAPQTFSSPVEEAAKSLPVSREELSGILGKVQQWEQPLLFIPAYVQARDRQDWATAAQIAANAGQPGVAQFYNALMEHGSRNAQNVTPAPQENAPTVTPYAPQENVVAAPPVQNASAPIPVVGVRPLVPDRLPDSTTGRRDLAHVLGRFMVANNIPISKGLRDDLSIGYGKAIRYADEKIRKWENERAGNAPQTAQDGAQSTETQADDRMLAQRGERAQNGSKAVREKSAQKQGNKKAANKGELVLADGYETESGRPLTEADPKEFIIKPNGSRNFGEITKAISNAAMEQSGVSLPIGEIRLRVGDDVEGLIHAKEHEAQALDAGYSSMEDLIADVAENFDRIYMRPPIREGQRPTYSLVKSGNKSAGIMNGVAPIYFELQTDGNGNYYIVISAMPKGDKPLTQQTKKDHLIYSSTSLDAAAESNAGAVSASAKNVGAESRGGISTSDKTGDLDISTISPEEAESKENPLHEDEQTALKGLSADAKDVYRLVRDKLADSSNKKVARAASVGAVLLARHADIIARKIRTALGKPFTAMDYYRNMFALKTEGDKTGANVLHQAANAGGKMYAQSAHAIPLDDGQGKVVDIQFVDVDEKRALQSPHIGIRFSDEEYKIGDDVENSHNWVDGDWTDEELDGASTVNVAEPWSYDSLDELKEKAIKRLNKAGRYPYDYAYLVAGTSSDYGEDTNESIIRNAEVVGILKLVRESEAESFNQQMNEIIKGTTQDIPNGQRIISLFEAADESTFLHEMGHLFLLDLEHLAPMSPTAEKDLATVKKWAAWREGQATEYKGTPFARSFAELDKKIRAALSAGNDRRADNLKRQWEHERFARGFEMYLKTGDAPTKGLRAVFAKFRAFLQRVYQAFTGTGGKATPEVEEVMARMISIEDASDLSAYPRGKETEVYTDSGKSIPVQYRVVSADDLITSHDASALEINPGYPSALQPRDRERVVMRQQVERMSNTLRPEELGEGRNLNQGAPLIRSDGVVLNGNGRTIAIARAQARNKERATAYRDYLVENAATFGLSREAVERVDNPVLVREVRGDISADTMNDIIGSTTGGSRMGASENAQADADKLTHTVMDTYVPNEKGDLTTAANRDFVAGVLHKVVGQGELNAYLDKAGHVNADGIQRVKRALFAAAYGDDEIVAKMAESTDDDTRNVSNGLMAAAPMMARLSVKKDVPHIRELRDAIADAVKQLDTLRRSGDSVKDYLGAQALFSEHEDSAEMREILSFLDENKRSGKRIGNYFTHIAEALDGMENPTDSDLFETQLPSLMDVFEEAKTHAETGGQDGLFGDNAQEVTEKNTQSEPLPDVQSPKRNVQNDPADMAQEEAEGKQKPTLGLFFQTEPALEKAALEYGAKSENGKVTFADAAQEKEFLQVAKALLSAGARKFSKAWTGSAADYDAPSLDYVGTGTGGAAYGYGLYYAEKRKTAEGYGDKLYHAEIPNADVLLDAGKSFDEQPPKVRKALEKLVRGLTLEQLENWNDVRRMGKAKVVAEIMDALSEADGTNIYGTISDLAEGQKEASELLNKYGVKGAVYNDEQNGRTFVVFDDKAIKILEKFSARRQEEIKKMLDGIALVSPNRLSPRKRALRDWGHEMGVPVVFFKGDPSLHGFHSDGVTFLNVDSEITPQWTFWHEAMHWMKANNPDLYNDIVHEISGAEGFTKKQLDAYRKEIGAEHMSDADVIEEMIADALPDVRRRVPLLRDVGKRDTGIIERLVAWVHDVMRRFHDHFFTPKGGLTNDQRRAMVRAFGNLVGSIRDADGKQIFRVANDGARITLRDGKPLPAVKYSLDNKAGAGDNKSNVGLTSAQKDIVCANVLARMKARVQDMLKRDISWDEIHKEMDDENSTSREEALRVFKTQWNIFNSPRVNRRNVVERITKNHNFSDEEVNELFDRYKAKMKEMLDYGGFIYKEAALQQRGDRGFLTGVHSWRSLERANREHGGSAHTGNEEKLNNENRSDNQDGFSMPKFSARTNGESRVGNFRRMMDALKSGVKPSPHVEVHDGRREVTADIGVSQVKRFMKDKRLTDDEVISRRELPNGKVRITYYARSAMDIGYADYAKSVRQVAKRNPFVKALYDLASKAMHKQEKLRNDFAKSLKEFAELVKNPADMEKVTEILWTGDATGKEYTSAELRAAGASDNVVRAYALVRRELKKAYELLNETRMQVKTRSKVLRPEDVESYMQSHWIRPSDVLSKTQTQDGNIELTWRGGKTYETKNKLMSAEELSLMEKDENINVTRAVPANAKAYGAGMYHVGYVERIKPINNLTGYMPHFFHEWMVYEQYKDPVSKEIRYTSVGSGRTLNEAVKIGNTIAEKNKDRNYVVRPKGFDMDAGNAVVVGDMEFAQMAKKLTESTQISLADARTFLRESAGATLKSRHRFFGNMMKRKGAEGFDKNIMWVLAHYFNSSARYIAMEDFKPSAISLYERCFGAFDSEPKNMTARYCKDLINDVNGNPRGVEVWLNDLIKGTWLGKRIADSYGDRAALAVNGELSTWNAITKLGLFNFASMAVNFSQFINVGAALNDYGYAAKGLLRALHPSALDEKIIEASGLLEDINLAADNGGYSQRRGGRAGTVYQKAKQFGEWTLTL